MPRLLRRRREFAELSDQNVASSITAFIAWKAYLIVAKGSASGEEKSQCEGLAVRVLGEFPELWSTVAAFVSRLRALRQLSPAAAADWYCDSAWEQSKVDGRVRWAMSTIKSMNEAMASNECTPRIARWIGEHAYAMRSAVLAHASVQSTGNLFQHIVPSFEHLVCHLACGGYALRAGIALADAREECHVT